MSSSLRGLIPIGHKHIRLSILQKGNMLGMAENKAEWAKNLNLPKGGANIFFAGCGYEFMRYAEGLMRAMKAANKVGIGIEKMIGLSNAFSKIGVDLTSVGAKLSAAWREDHYTRVLVSAVSVLRKLGVEIGYMHEDEPCCGSPMYYSGFVEDYAENANRNYEIFKSFGVKKLIGLVPACTVSLRNLYPKYVKGYDLEVHHFFEIVLQRLRETDIKLRLNEKLIITYHDPCQSSRYLNIIDEPREIINRIEGLELKEPKPEQCRQWSTCCGGGGLETINPRLSERMGIRRMEELLATGATTIATNCPACMMQLRSAARKLKAKVKVIDLIEIIDNALE